MPVVFGPAVLVGRLPRSCRSAWSGGLPLSLFFLSSTLVVPYSEPKVRSRDRHRREAGLRLLPSDDFDSYLGRRRERRGWSTFSDVSRIEHLARPYWFDLLIALLAIMAMLEVVLGRGSSGAPTTTLWFCLPALAILVLPLFARRWFPFAGPAAYWLLAAGISFVDPLLIPYPESLFLIGLAAAFLLGNLRDVRRAGLGLAIVVGATATLIFNIPGHSVDQLVFIPVDFAVAWVAGLAVRTRVEQAEVAESHATQVEQERDAATRVAVAEERTRIARELHDIVAHAVSVMVLQVGAVRHQLPDAMAEDRDALRGVEQAGRGALAEMRSLLSVMRRDGDGLELAPQPGLDGLDSLIKELGRASHAEVTVRYAPDEVASEVRDDGTGATPSDGHGHGHGLIGIRERVRLYGGEMTAGTTNGGGFTLSTRLPLTPDRP